MKPKNLSNTPKFQWSEPAPEDTETVPDALRRTAVACGVPEFEISFVAHEAMAEARENYPDASDSEIIGIACGSLF